MSWQRDRWRVDVLALRLEVARYRSFAHRVPCSDAGVAQKQKDLGICSWKIESAIRAVRARKKILDGERNPRNLRCVCGHHRSYHWSPLSDPKATRQIQQVRKLLFDDDRVSSAFCHVGIGTVRVVATGETIPAHECPCREFKVGRPRRRYKPRLLSGA